MWIYLHRLQAFELSSDLDEAVDPDCPASSWQWGEAIFGWLALFLFMKVALALRGQAQGRSCWIWGRHAQSLACWRSSAYQLCPCLPLTSKASFWQAMALHLLQPTAWETQSTVRNPILCLLPRWWLLGRMMNEFLAKPIAFWMWVHFFFTDWDP